MVVFGHPEREPNHRLTRVVNNTVRIPIRFKIFGMTLSLLALLGLVAYSSQKRLQRVSNTVDDFADYVVPIANAVSEVNVHTLEQEVHFERLLKLHARVPLDVPQIQKEWQQFAARSQQVEQIIQSAIALTQEGLSQSSIQLDRQEFTTLAALLTHIEQEHQTLRNQASKIVRNLNTPGQRQSDIAIATQIAQIERAPFDREIERTRKALESFTVQTAQLSQHQQGAVLRDSLLITHIAILLGMVYAAGMTLGIVRPVRTLTQRIQKRRTDAPEPALQIQSRDEVGVLASTFNHMLQELALKDHLQEMFGKYVDPRIVQRLTTGTQQDLPPAEKQVITVQMSDLGGIDLALQTQEPEQLVEVLNQYLSLLSPTISARQGFVEFFETVILGFWAAPFVCESSQAELACEAALAQVSKLEELRHILRDKIDKRLDLSQVNLHIGLATGPVVLANMGPEWSRTYTVMGDTVNTAARLKGAAQQYGVHIILLEATQQQVQETMTTRELGLLQVLGKEETLRVYELLGRHTEISTEQMGLNTLFAQGLEAFRHQHWDQAQNHFETILQVHPQDGPSQHYREWIQQLRDQQLPNDWQGVWRLTKK